VRVRKIGTGGTRNRWATPELRNWHPPVHDRGVGSEEAAFAIGRSVVRFAKKLH